VIETGESGVSIGDSEAAGLRRELERMRTELQNTTSEKLRLEGELDEKKRVTTELSLRVDEVTKRIGKGNQQENGAPSAATPDEKAAFVARINRLEAALAAATQENRRLKGA
jgi:chromosome segregation ATPase